MSMLRNALIKASGNNFIQRLLEKNVLISQYLMGIGSGGGVLLSGESAIFDIIKRHLQPPYCIFDVGSNKGQFMQLVIDNLAADTFRIHCFEPSGETFKVLADVAPKGERVTLNNIGLGKKSGQVLLHSDHLCSGLASLTKRKLDHFGIDFSLSEAVQVETIDSYCQEKSIDHIALLKIDVEGHEYDVLLGAKKMFASRAVDVVTFEFGGCNIDTRTFFQDFWYFFRGNGFKLFRITPSGCLYPIDSYMESHEQFRTANFMAVSENLLGIQAC